MTQQKSIRIINPSTRWVAFGDYLCGVEYDVSQEVAAALASRGFVPVASFAPASAPVSPVTPTED